MVAWLRTCVCLLLSISGCTCNGPPELNLGRLPPSSFLSEILQRALAITHPAKVEEEFSEVAGPNTPPRPHIRTQFAAPVEVIVHGGGLGGKGRFVYDLTKRSVKSELESVVDFVSQLQPPFYTHEANLVIGSTTWMLTGGKERTCRKMPGPPFSDMFTWASLPGTSKFLGFKSIGGRNCTLWGRVQTQDVGLNQTLCADGDEPVEFLMQVSGQGVSNMTVLYQFGPLAEVEPGDLDVPIACHRLAPPCKLVGDTDPLSIEAYVFHPGMSADDYNIADQNVADLRGEMLFICSDRIHGGSSIFDHNYTRVSLYELKLARLFAQYEMCNGYPDTLPPGPHCFGGDVRLVGREAPYFSGENELRCALDSPLGFWYSLPKQGQCSPGESPVANPKFSGCTWSVVKRVKTVGQRCLFEEQHLLNYCKEDLEAGVGFNKSSAALLRAFATEDVAKGGCPDVGGPPIPAAYDAGVVLSSTTGLAHAIVV